MMGEGAAEPNGATPGRFVKDATPAPIEKMRKWERSATSHGDRFDAGVAVADYDAAHHPKATEAKRDFLMNRFVATFNRLRKKLATTPPLNTPT